MSWDGSDRRERLPEDWPARRAACIAAAGGRCQALLPSGARCPRPATDADHKVPNDDHGPRNLQALCKHHHGKKSAGEGNAARRRPSAKRPAEDHPGWRGR